MLEITEGGGQRFWPVLVRVCVCEITYLIYLSECVYK